jgi:hypothetical protein
VRIGRELRRIFGPKRDEINSSGKDYIMRGPTICTDHQI